MSSPFTRPDAPEHPAGGVRRFTATDFSGCENCYGDIEPGDPAGCIDGDDGASCGDCCDGAEDNDR